MIPYPDPVVIQILGELPPGQAVGDRISVTLDSTLPAIRIAKVGDLEAPTTWEATPLYQVEVWDKDEAVSGQLAWDVANHWPTSRRAVVGPALVHGRWVHVNPNHSPDPETGLSRHLLTVGIRLSGAPA